MTTPAAESHPHFSTYENPSYTLPEQSRPEAVICNCEQETAGAMGHRYLDYVACVVLSVQYDMRFVWNERIALKPRGSPQKLFRRLSTDIGQPVAPVHIVSQRDKYVRKRKERGGAWTGLFAWEMHEVVRELHGGTVCLVGSTRVNLISLDTPVFLEVCRQLRLRYGKPTKLPNDKFVFTMHVRRGDIAGTDNLKNVDIGYYRGVLEVVAPLIKSRNPVMNLCTDSPKMQEVVDLANDFSLSICGGTKFEDFDTMVNSHLLFVGPSSFSTIASYLSEGVKIQNSPKLWPYSIWNQSIDHVSVGDNLGPDLKRALDSKFPL